MLAAMGAFGTALVSFVDCMPCEVQTLERVLTGTVEKGGEKSRGFHGPEGTSAQIGAKNGLTDTGNGPVGNHAHPSPLISGQDSQLLVRCTSQRVNRFSDS